MLKKITDNIMAETDVPGSNHSLVITSEGTVTIDTPQLPKDALRWKEEIVKYGITRYIINTEPHGDHVGGNYFLDGTVIAHEGTRQTIKETPVQMYLDMVKQMDPVGAAALTNYSFRLPSITYHNKMTIHLGKHTFQLMNLPGHTPFQTAVYVPEEKALFTSDNVVNKSLPFMFPISLLGEWFKTLEYMQTLDVKYVVPGHGEIGDKSRITDMIEELNIWKKEVSGATKKGLTLQEIQKTVDLMPRYPSSPMPPERMRQVHNGNIAVVYEYLKKESFG